MHWLAEHAPKDTTDQFTKLSQVTARHIKKEAEIILKLLYLARSRILRKNQRRLLNRQYLRRILKFGFGCNFWLSTLASMFKVYKAGWLTETLLREKGKEIYNLGNSS